MFLANQSALFPLLAPSFIASIRNTFLSISFAIDSHVAANCVRRRRKLVEGKWRVLHVLQATGKMFAALFVRSQRHSSTVNTARADVNECFRVFALDRLVFRRFLRRGEALLTSSLGTRVHFLPGTTLIDRRRISREKVRAYIDIPVLDLDERLDFPKFPLLYVFTRSLAIRRK